MSEAATTEESRKAGEKITASLIEERRAAPPKVFVAAGTMLDPIRWYVRDFATPTDPNSAEVVVVLRGSSQERNWALRSATVGRVERLPIVVAKNRGRGPHPDLEPEVPGPALAQFPQDRIETVEATVAWHSGADSGTQVATAAEQMRSEHAAPGPHATTVARGNLAPESASRALAASATSPQLPASVAAQATRPTREAEVALNASQSLTSIVSEPLSPNPVGRRARLPLSAKVAGSQEISNFAKASHTRIAALEPATQLRRRVVPNSPKQRTGPDSKVLIVGGQDEQGGFITASAEFFDAASGNFMPLKSGMADPRESYSATKLPNGQVLIAGGRSTVDGDIVATAEIFDPGLGTFTPTHRNMTAARQAHTATSLANGKVLIAGGFNPLDGVLSSGELFDPATGVFSSAGGMTDGRRSHTATALRDGCVLIAGGIDQSERIAASAEIFDPISGGFTATADMHDSRYQHTATALKNGRILITGGINDAGEVLASAEIFDPATHLFRRAAGKMSIGRYSHVATLLRNGMVLVSGGFTNRSSGVTPSSELFDPASEIFIVVGDMNEPRQSHAATLLGNGKVLITGGGLNFNGRVANSAELFDPATRKFTLIQTRMVESREVHTATLLR